MMHPIPKFHACLFILLTSCLSFTSAYTQEYCRNNLPPAGGPFESDPDYMCISFSNEAAEPPCIENAGMVFSSSSLSPWIEESTTISNRWTSVPANENITVEIVVVFDLGGPPGYNSTMQVSWRDEWIPVSMSQTSVSGNPALEATINIPAGPANIEGDLPEPMRFLFFDGPSPAFEAAAMLFLEGPGIINNPDWVTTAPSIPEIILRDPPGDGSFTELLEGQETCHGHGMSLAQDASASIWGSASLGVSGEVGFLVTSDVETYVEVTGGLEMGMVQTTEMETKFCVRATNNYSTGIEDPILEENSGDLYIGSSITYAYGISKFMSLDETCTVQEENSLAFLPVSSNGYFIYPETYITNTIIPDLEQALQDLDPNSDAYREATDQLEVWEQNIQMNADIKAEALATQTPTTQQFLGGTSFTNTVTTTTSTSREYEYNIYVDAFAAVEAGAYIGNTGGSAGAEIRTKITKGNSQNASNAHTSEITYSFNDDDAGIPGQSGDLFTVDIYQDLTFGTPIFDLVEAGTASSCPYEGGQLIDDPDIAFTIDGGTDLTFDNIPSGETFTFEVDICNESDFAREYFVKVPFESNLNGLQVTLAGTPINVSDGVTTDLIPANTCLEGVDVTISQTDGSAELNYEDVRILVFAPCQPAFLPTSADLTFDANFSDPLSVNDRKSEASLVVYPNPNNGSFTVDLGDIQSVSNLEIHDLTGRLVFQKQVVPNQGNLDIDLEDAAKGMYLLSVANSDQRSVCKFSVK